MWEVLWAYGAPVPMKGNLSTPGRNQALQELSIMAQILSPTNPNFTFSKHGDLMARQDLMVVLAPFLQLPWHGGHRVQRGRDPVCPGR